MRTRGFSTAIRFRACTTSGQFWQLSEMKTSNVKSPCSDLDLLDHGRVDLGRMAAGLQQRQHERRELVAHRNARELDADIRAEAVDPERGQARTGGHVGACACCAV